jgi:hypothetical protein
MFSARVCPRVQEVADVQLRIKECIDIKQELSTAIQQANELHIQVVCLVVDYIHPRVVVPKLPKLVSWQAC